MLREQVFSDISNYPKPVNPDWQSAVAEYLEEVGATDLDAPDAPKRKIQRTDAQLRELEGIEKAKAEARARAEHQAALARLNDGTAIHRQKKERTPVLSKAVKAKTVRPAAATKRKYAKRNSSKAAFDEAAAIERRMAMISTLKSGGKIEQIPQKRCEGGYAEYQTQYTDIRWIGRVKGLVIARIQRFRSNTSYFVLDDFERYELPEPISGYAEEKQKMLTALLSKKLVLASDIDSSAKVASRTIAALAEIHDLDVYTVFESRSVHGWIFIMDEEKRKAKLKEVGDLLQALDFLEERKLRKENDRLPMHVPDVILDAAYREFKRVAKDAGATIEEVLAVKESH